MWGASHGRDLPVGHALEPPPPCSRSPCPSLPAQGTRVHGALVSNEGQPKTEEPPDGSSEPPSRLRPPRPESGAALRSPQAPTSASAAPADSTVDSAYLLREVRALWTRLRSLERDIEMLVEFAETAQRRFRVMQPRRAR